MKIVFKKYYSVTEQTKFVEGNAFRKICSCVDSSWSLGKLPDLEAYLAHFFAELIVIFHAKNILHSSFLSM